MTVPRATPLAASSMSLDRGSPCTAPCRAGGRWGRALALRAHVASGDSGRPPSRGVGTDQCGHDPGSCTCTGRRYRVRAPLAGSGSRGCGRSLAGVRCPWPVPPGPGSRGTYSPHAQPCWGSRSPRGLGSVGMGRGVAPVALGAHPEYVHPYRADQRQRPNPDHAAGGCLRSRLEDGVNIAEGCVADLD